MEKPMVDIFEVQAKFHAFLPVLWKLGYFCREYKVIVFIRWIFLVHAFFFPFENLDYFCPGYVQQKS